MCPIATFKAKQAEYKSIHISANALLYYDVQCYILDEV